MWCGEFSRDDPQAAFAVGGLPVIRDEIRHAASFVQTNVLRLSSGEEERCGTKRSNPATLQKPR
jgi:hypothetical protein